jgi:hypothetical protein
VLVWTLLHADPQCPSRTLLAKIAQSQISIAMSIRHLNRWRVAWQLNRRKGRPRRVPAQQPVATNADVVQVTPRLSYVGVRLLATWLDQQGLFGTVVEQLMRGRTTCELQFSQSFCSGTDERIGNAHGLLAPPRWLRHSGHLPAPQRAVAAPRHSPQPGVSGGGRVAPQGCPWGDGLGTGDLGRRRGLMRCLDPTSDPLIFD